MQIDLYNDIAPYSPKTTVCLLPHFELVLNLTCEQHGENVGVAAQSPAGRVLTEVNIFQS